MVGEQVRLFLLTLHPLGGPRVGSHVLTKQETWLEGACGRTAAGWGSSGDISATWPLASGFMGLVFRLSLARHCDSGFISCILFSFLTTSYYRWGSPDTLYLFGSRNHILRENYTFDQFKITEPHMLEVVFCFIFFVFAHVHVKTKYQQTHLDGFPHPL